ncbi:hypothetical protein RFI_05163 [Reticulomyxa filosa]|uniref:Fe2OG dioxygenase domain-containing protein n=1 Tax=Reticulomyxa filosa TaxID=46433 RepID=X6P1E2_RETFI|nr:hypothetical protein RFI_05163 [Reticulomyxa filosa]|eukprot:ETO31953.1 hypothetical protein RFI_05163 [Reticulomyxa filosa]
MAKKPEIVNEPTISPYSSKKTENAQNTSKVIKNEVLSTQLHGLFGLDHYPNYLLRWNIADINKLENYFHQTLALISKQKQQLMSIYEITNEFKEGILHKFDYVRNFEKVFHPKFLENVDIDIKGDGKLYCNWNFNAISELLVEEIEHVYSFPLLCKEFCEQIVYHGKQFVTFIQNLSEKKEKEGEEKEKEKKQNTELLLSLKRCVLDWMSLHWLNDLLLNEIVNGIATKIYQSELYYNCKCVSTDPSVKSQIRKLNWRHGYLIGYRSKEELLKQQQITTSSDNLLFLRSELIPHTDDSEITLNICLTKNFEGGKLILHGLRNNSASTEDIYEIICQQGYAIIHPGRLLHQVTPVTKGERIMLIVWCRDTVNLRNQVCPCCWINRRSDTNCIAGDQWN